MDVGDSWLRGQHVKEAGLEECCLVCEWGVVTIAAAWELWWQAGDWGLGHTPNASVGGWT